MSYARNRRRRLIRQGRWHPALDHTGTGAKVWLAPREHVLTAATIASMQPTRAFRDIRLTTTEET